MPACKGQNAKGEPCKSTGVRHDGYCAAHTTLVPAEQRFGNPQQAREAATGVVRKYPRLREQVERKIEERAERIVDAQLEALDATRAVVVGEGDDAYVEHHPDYLTRLRAGDTLLSRALGKPGQTLDVQSENRSITLTLDASDPETRQTLHEFLRSRPAAA
jgi:hypothetical protein